MKKIFDQFEKYICVKKYVLTNIYIFLKSLYFSLSVRIWIWLDQNMTLRSFRLQLSIWTVNTRVAAARRNRNFVGGELTCLLCSRLQAEGCREGYAVLLEINPYDAARRDAAARRRHCATEINFRRAHRKRHSHIREITRTRGGTMALIFARTGAARGGIFSRPGDFFVDRRRCAAESRMRWLSLSTLFVESVSTLTRVECRDSHRWRAVISPRVLHRVKCDQSRRKNRFNVRQRDENAKTECSEKKYTRLEWHLSSVIQPSIEEIDACR